ncbi:ANK1 [Symbiodinium sp. CCMP2592]|nr:ANK1 [Symbiodinium sp. CCMP2592]
MWVLRAEAWQSEMEDATGQPTQGAKEAQQSEERPKCEETGASAATASRGRELPEVPAGWSRYFDPQHGTYLYHEATGDWHLEEAEVLVGSRSEGGAVEEVAQSWLRTELRGQNWDSWELRKSKNFTDAWACRGSGDVGVEMCGGDLALQASSSETASGASNSLAGERIFTAFGAQRRRAECLGKQQHLTNIAACCICATTTRPSELMGAACSTEWGEEKALAEEQPGMPGYRGSKALAARKAKAHLTVRHWHDKMMMSAASQAVFEGAQRGDAKKVTEALNAHGDPNCINFGGFNALMLAVGGGYTEVIALLLQASANPNNGKSGLTPLMIAASSGQLEVARMLVNCGAAATGHCELDGRTALHGAARRGHADVAKLLVQAGASVDIGDWQECTALMLASQEGHGDVLKVLLCAGASVSLSNKSGDSALSACVKSGHEACLETMLRAGAPVNAANKSTGNSALAEASRVGSEAMVRKLLQYQANVNFGNLRKETPLMLAAAAGHEQVVRMLLVSGANTAAEDVNGHTPIMHAAVSNVAVVQALLDFGGNPSVVSQVDCNTPSTLAAMHGRKQCYDLLVWAGAFVPALEESQLNLNLSVASSFFVDSDAPQTPLRRVQGLVFARFSEALASEPCSANGGGSVSSDAGSARPKVVSELAKLDPIVRDFVRDEFRLKKKLREIEALEAAGASGKTLEAAQVAKVSKKGQVLSDLRLVDQHISEALADFQKRQPVPLAPRSSEQQAAPGARSSGSSKVWLCLSF